MDENVWTIQNNQFPAWFPPSTYTYCAPPYMLVLKIIMPHLVGKDVKTKAVTYNHIFHKDYVSFMLPLTACMNSQHLL